MCQNQNVKIPAQRNKSLTPEPEPDPFPEPVFDPGPELPVVEGLPDGLLLPGLKSSSQARTKLASASCASATGFGGRSVVVSLGNSPFSSPNEC